MNEEVNLTDEFENTARLYGEAIAASDVNAVNHNADRMSRLFQQLLTSSSERRRFLSLLNHDEAGVRLMASAFGLRIDEPSSIRVLEALAKDGPFSFEAKQCLARWKSGEWALDVPPTNKQDSIDGIGSFAENVDAISFGRSIPRRVSLSEVVGVEDLDVRIGCVNVYFANIIGVDDSGVEFCPNSDPATKEETLAWTWVVRPDMTRAILEQLGEHGFAEGIRQLA